MEERMSESNRLPGSEKLTKPEEIGQLSKYLKKVKEVYDESTRLEDQVIGVSGFSTGKIPTIDSLDNKIVTAPENQGEEVSLSNKILGLEKQGEEVELENSKVDIPITGEQDLGLSEKVNHLPENTTEEEVMLSEVIQRLQDIQDQEELPETRVDLEDEREEIALESTRLDIKAIIDASLSNKRINLSDTNEVNLEDEQIKLEGKKDVGLGDKKVELGDDREVSLGEKRLDIQDAKTSALENKRVNLSAEDGVESLGNKKVEIKDDSENNLSEKVLKIEREENPELEDKKVNLVNSGGGIELENKKVEINDESSVSLSDKLLKIKNDEDLELETEKVKLEDNGKKPGLEKTRVDIKDTRKPKLEDKKVKIKDNTKTSLSKKILNLKINKEEEIKLEEGIVEMIEDDNYNSSDDYLSDKLLKLEDTDDPVVDLVEKSIEITGNENGEPEELYDSLIGVPENENGEPEELYDSLIGIPEEGLKKEESLSGKLIRAEENKNIGVPKLTDGIESIQQYTNLLNDSELYNYAMKLASEGEGGSGGSEGWMQKIEALMSSYLSSDVLTPKRAIEFRDAMNNSLEMGYFGSQIAMRIPVDTSSGTTYAKAEGMIGTSVVGSSRRAALDEMIVRLVNYNGNTMPSLPGDGDLMSTLSGVGQNLMGALTGSTGGERAPMNKPMSSDGLAVPGGPGDTVYQAANNRMSWAESASSPLSMLGNMAGTAFYDRYWSSKSFKTTLEELCPTTGKAPIVSLAELKALLKASPYITTPGKFTTDSKGSYNTFSLDTNMYWEVTITPYCNQYGDCSNGEYSFLPAIGEINVINKCYHEVYTGYGNWAPINGFELQKSKMSTKSLPLYEGEIFYPTGIEYTNELRLTFVDDAWKSWKRYFEKCVETSVYNSEAHGIGHYRAKKMKEKDLTKIDKTNICIAYYKNVTFNIKIYILNPQLNLINKYDLLCVLKDYSEEYIGEIDSGGADLNVTFSIVGENPNSPYIKPIGGGTGLSIAKTAVLEVQKRVSGAVNSRMGLL